MTGFSEADLIGRLPPFPHWPPDRVEENARLFQQARDGADALHASVPQDLDTDCARAVEEDAQRKRLVENGIFPVCRRCCKVELSPEPVAEPFGAGVPVPARRAIPLTVVR